MKLSEEERELIKGMIEVQQYHALRCETMSKPVASRQKEKDLKRITLLTRILEESE